MAEGKTSFVGAKKGELSVMLSASEITLGVDLAMPGQAPFMIKAPLQGDVPLLFADLVQGLAALVHGYFEAQGISPDLLAQLDHNLQAAVTTLDNRYTETRYSDTGSGVLDDVRDIENETLFEAEFDLPEGFLQQAHYRVVTANAPIIRRTPLFQPRSVKTGPQTQIVQRPVPSLKNIIQKYRGQQGKPLSGPMYVLVYDSTGRPVGVRSIKGPGWKGIGGGGKIAAQEEPDPPFHLLVLKGGEEHPAPDGSPISTCTRRTCTQCGEGGRCRCMSKFHDPDDPSFRGAIKVEHILCDACAQQQLKLASKDTITVKNWRTNPERIEVYLNPSRSEFKGTCMKDSHVARAWVFPKQNQVVAWAGYTAIHDDIAKDYLPLLGLSYRDGITIEAHSDSDILITDYCRNSSWFHDPKAAEALETCPALLQAMGGYITYVTYFDEDRVGDWAELEAPGAAVQPVDTRLKTSSVKQFNRLVVAQDAGAITGILAFADYPHDRRILRLQAANFLDKARMLACLGDDKPIIAMASPRAGKKTVREAPGGALVGYISGRRAVEFGSREAAKANAQLWQQNAYACIDEQYDNDWTVVYRIAYENDHNFKGKFPSLEAALTAVPDCMRIIKVFRRGEAKAEIIDRDLQANPSPKISKDYFENEGLEELGFAHVGDQLVKQAGTAHDIMALRPDTVLSVFHGCQPDDASQFCAEGIDTLSQHGYRRYPHTDLGQPVLNGLFVAPDFQTAHQFGRVVVKFKTEAKNLHYLYPSQEAEADELYRERFPKSFRPSVSQTLVGNLNTTYDPRTGGYAGYEHQALFLGTVSPRAIEKVYLLDPETQKWTGLDPYTFIKSHEAKHADQVQRGIEPQESFKDFDSFLDRFAEVEDYPLAELEATLSWMGPDIAQAQNPLAQFAGYFNSVPRIVLQRVLPLLVAKYAEQPTPGPT